MSYIRRVDSRGGTHTHEMTREEKKEEDNRIRAFDLKARVIKWLIETHYPEGLSNKIIIERHLKEAIMSVENLTDKRPIANRIQLLLSKKCIMKAFDDTGAGYEFLGLEPKPKLEQETEPESIKQQHIPVLDTLEIPAKPKVGQEQMDKEFFDNVLKQDMENSE
jgi:hypothetical protein